MSIHGGLVNGHHELELNPPTQLGRLNWLMSNIGGVMLVGMSVMVGVGLVLM